ncbi:MAG: sulfatase-like hydrolase/transferase [Caldilineaceae bacterium SB0662_bin_9]|uniref:Sulfatase-like hydrolase/transferase n=1 Tax=Caldilineaceae bacterium SB0662_bin_9 TaxID=2605258 RepID=A0A6B1DZ09_9CHLR|nr:sulfatase-like hydrolase/transferase [Caldilineaceae bacterium]MYD91912.1 sulfatase-like hydrolase/transferase [Caldilineaceae bacterium SB0662_bin_9]
MDKVRPANLLFILSDQHNPKAMGNAGSPEVHTPNLDRLAAGGTRFSAAYTPCPICVPARASLATGRYVHQLRTWDNSMPYTGSVPSWHHRLREAGHRVDSIGKLHFRGAQDDNGFSREIEPLHIVDGQGDILASVRRDPPRRQAWRGVREAGSGNSTYLEYDRRNTANAKAWLQTRAEADELPWALFLSYVCPHPPYIAPPEYFELYDPDSLTLPPEPAGSAHPALAWMRQFFSLEDVTETEMRRMMAAYYGVCTFLDDQIGQVLNALTDLGLAANTRVLYSSDHGESHGARGLFGKFSPHDETCAVPLIMAGPEIPAGRTCEVPVNLVDCFQTVLEATGVAEQPEDRDLPGQSLFGTLADEAGDRTVFSEYHTVGTEDAWYLLRNRRYKYVHFTGRSPLLYDMFEDPLELTNLADLPEHAARMRGFADELRALLDPDSVNAEAHSDQVARVAAAGGRAAVLARGAFTNSPVPGEQPAFRSFAQ